jgi:hypothetical protein
VLYSKCKEKNKNKNKIQEPGKLKHVHCPLTKRPSPQVLHNECITKKELNK